MTIDTANTPFRFAVTASFTAEPLRPIVSFWGARLNASFRMEFAPYNQLAQSLLDPSSALGTNTHGLNIVLTRAQDLGPVEDPTRLDSNVRELLRHVRSAAAEFSAPLVFCLCPSASGQDSLDKHVCSTLAEALEDTPNVHFLHYGEIERHYPVASIHDPDAERLGKIPYTELYYCALGTNLVRHAHALFRPPFKVIALDCDNTLWEGICGEDGPEGVVLDPPRRALQEFMADQHECGMLLTMASKNNEQDVLDTFAAHPEMPLALRHFTARRLNWQPKPENLLSLAAELSLGLDSFIFVDDNPKECAELAGAMPQVLTLALPADVSRIPEFLKHVWAFDHPVVTEEDRNRNAYYVQQHEFGAEVGRAATLEDFMATLDLRVNIQALAPERLPRVAQLTQRTNQFNLSTIRRSENDLKALAGHEIYTAEVADRFGEYGLTGVVIAKPEHDELVIDTFLLSCRVLGRGVEHRIAAFLGETASARGLSHVVLPYSRTHKNAPAAEFLRSIGFAQTEETPTGFVVRVPSEQLASLRWSPPEKNVEPVTPARSSPRPQAVTRSVDYARIANELSTAEAILAAMREARAQAQSTGSMTETEARLAEIWGDLLRRPGIRAADNFFDLGGHSLLAVQLLLRVRESFGVELSIDDVYSGKLTLSDLAARVETAQLGGIDPEEYAALLAEIEGLTDEEARQLLEESTNPHADR